jgi:broad specificity phosphatase PhoE
MAGRGGQVTQADPFVKVDCRLTFSRILLARHGETEWNRSGRRQGIADSALTERGLEEAARLASVAAALGVDKVYSSPLARCITTSRIVMARIGSPFEVIDDLRELDLGVTTGLTWNELDESFREFLTGRSRDKFRTRWPGGESYEDVFARVGGALNHIAQDGSKLPLVVSHEMVTKVILAVILGRESDPRLSKRLPHGRIVDVDLERLTSKVIVMPDGETG